MHRILTVALALALTAATASAQQPSPAAVSVDAPVVVTTGEGIVQAVPDRAFITISAESRAPSPREAQRKNTEAMTPVQEKLRGAGIPAEAIRTIGYDVQYEWDFVNNKRVGRGYVARNTIEVRVDNVDRLGDYLEIAVASGATSLGGIRFDLKDRSKLEREALRAAVSEARAKAEAAAAGAGRAIERIIRIDEHGAVATPMPLPRVMLKEQAQFSAADAAPPIATGQIEIRSTVTVTSILK
jgi:uncharacterized protein YggE